VTLLYSDAGEVSQALEKYLATTGTSRGAKLLGDARISAMSQTNTVMISASKDEVDRLVEITKTMDIAGEKGSIPQIIPMKFAKAGMILPSVQAVFTESRGGAGRRNQPPPVIVADDGANALIVRAGPTEMAAIESIVRQLDTEDAADRTPYKLVQVKAGINVTDLADQVETTINQSAETWGSGMRGGGKTPKITITPNLRTNSLMIGGDSSLFAQAETLIKTLEEMGPTGNVGTRIVGVKNVKVDQIQKLIDQLTQQGGGQGSSGGGRRSKPAGRP
jgi:type II secretory pathway component GspD/PulD (secretin)